MSTRAEPRLPPPDRFRGFGSVLSRRRSTREFTASPLRLEVLGQLLWAGYGYSGPRRTAPSAHRLYALDLVVVTGPLEHHGSGTLIPPAAYRYHPEQHRLKVLAAGDHRSRVAGAALADSAWLATAPGLIVVAADLAAVGRHFADQPQPAERGPRYVWTEFGHLSQNVYLQAADLGTGAVLVGGVDDNALRDAMADITKHAVADPLGIIALGAPRTPGSGAVESLNHS